MFYVAEAFLSGDGLSFSSHSAVASNFGQKFARQGRVPVELHRYLLDAERDRLKGDYDPSDTVRVDRAAEHLDRARVFLETAERLIGPLPPVPHES